MPTGPLNSTVGMFIGRCQRAGVVKNAEKLTDVNSRPPSETVPVRTARADHVQMASPALWFVRGSRWEAAREKWELISQQSAQYCDWQSLILVTDE